MACGDKVFSGLPDAAFPLLGTLVNSFPGVIMFAVDRDYRYMMFNERHRQEMLKVWKAEIELGASILGYMTLDETRQKAKASFDRVLEGESFTETQAQPDTDISYTFQWKAILDREASVIGVLASIMDNIELRKIERSLFKSDKLLEESQSIAKLGGWEYDVLADRFSWTAEVYRIHGVDKSFNPNDVQKNIGFYLPQDAVIIAEAFRKATETGEPYDLELQLRKADGNIIWVRTMAKVETLEGKIVRVVGNIMDISDRKIAQLELQNANLDLESRVRERTAKLEQANKDLEFFSHSVAHDLKAPLRAIAGFSRIVSEDYSDILDAEGKRLLGIVRENAFCLDQLISDILNLSHVAKAQVNRAPVAMGAMATAMYHETASADELGAVSVQYGDMPDAMGDSGLLRKVWGILISNALKFTSKNPVRVIEIYSEAKGTQTRYCVRDNGIGFPAQHADKLFKLFQRLHSKADYPGTGAGLAIAKRIIELHGGTMGSDSVEGQGALFWFALPGETEAV